MTDERRLHILVAEALGWTLFYDHWRLPNGSVSRDIPPYGEDSPEGWACTGPLMESRGVFQVGVADGGDGEYEAWAHGAKTPRGIGPDVVGSGGSACEAIARCVVALAAAGKLAARPPSS